LSEISVGRGAKLSLGVGAICFILDWSGYDRFNVDLFAPKALADVWWHLPAWIAFWFIGWTVASRNADQDAPTRLGERRILRG
jgi:hypothetical protein